MTITELTTFLGWMTIVNLIVFLSAFLVLTNFRKKIAKFHKKLFHVSEDDMCRSYVKYLAKYKLFIWVFNLTPYIALRIMYS